MFGKIAYYILVIPASYLPLFILYLITDFFYLLLISVLPYRRKVVRGNIERSFTDKSKKEQRKIERKFYRFFTDLLAEACKNLTISKRSLTKRVVVENPEVLNDFYDNGQSVILVSGHYNNWEWFIKAQDFLFKHQGVGVGKPMTNPFWNKKVNARRESFGMRVINPFNLKEKFKEFKVEGNPFATLLLADQSTADSLKSYWTTFLNQDTAVIYGPEILALQHDFPVVFFHLEKKKRGHYKVHLKTITSNPRQTDWGEITNGHVSLMEAVIKNNPENWVWSHKRWKREIPENFEELKANQKLKFEQLKAKYQT